MRSIALLPIFGTAFARMEKNTYDIAPYRHHSCLCSNVQRIDTQNRVTSVDLLATDDTFHLCINRWTLFVRGALRITLEYARSDAIWRSFDWLPIRVNLTQLWMRCGYWMHHYPSRNFAQHQCCISWCEWITPLNILVGWLTVVTHFALSPIQIEMTCSLNGGFLCTVPFVLREALLWISSKSLFYLCNSPLGVTRNSFENWSQTYQTLVAADGICGTYLKPGKTLPWKYFFPYTSQYPTHLVTYIILTVAVSCSPTRKSWQRFAEYKDFEPLLTHDIANEALLAHICIMFSR